MPAARAYAYALFVDAPMLRAVSAQRSGSADGGGEDVLQLAMETKLARPAAGVLEIHITMARSMNGAHIAKVRCVCRLYRVLRIAGEWWA